MQQRLEVIAASMSEEALDLELGSAGISVPKGADRAEKIRLFATPPKAVAANPACTQSSRWTWVHFKCFPSAQKSRADKLLEKRKRWLAEWQSWDDARLVQRLRYFGVDGAGCRRDVLINHLLQVETERFGRTRCTAHVMHAFGLFFVAVMILV